MFCRCCVRCWLGLPRLLSLSPNNDKCPASLIRLLATRWEGGHRVVGLARWTNTVRPAVSHALAGTIDFMPTFASLAGVPLPADRHFDGVDLSRVLLHGEDSAGHTVLYHQDGRAQLNAMRYGDFKV